MARTFARKGHAVLAVARREERLQALCRETAEKHQATVHCLALDITSQGAPNPSGESRPGFREGSRAHQRRRDEPVSGIS